MMVVRIILLLRLLIVIKLCFGYRQQCYSRGLIGPRWGPEAQRILQSCKATGDEWDAVSSNKQHRLRYFTRNRKSNKLAESIAPPTQRFDDDLGPQSSQFRSGFVSILGNPNVGKSTLMNRILRQDLCIVSPKPQTTRHRILGILTEEAGGATPSSPAQTKVLHEYSRHGYQLVFSDTPGMLNPSYKLQETMQHAVRGAAGDADVLVLVTDVYGGALADDRIMAKLSLTNRPVIVAINKIDLKPRPTPSTDSEPRGPDDTQDSSDTSQCGQCAGGGKQRGISGGRFAPGPVLPLDEAKALWRQRLPRAELVPISAAKDQGIPQLLAAILHHISPGGPMYYPSETVTTRDERFFASEIVRECLLKLYKNEIPYSCEVVIESFTDKHPNQHQHQHQNQGSDGCSGDTGSSAGLSVIEASIVASRQSQKSILIGEGGSKIKALGIMARKRLEEFLDRRVYLSLRVRVDEDWRSSDAALARYGYIDRES